MLYWIHNPLGAVTAKSAYWQLISDTGPVATWWWDLSIWQGRVPLKIICFFWLLMNRRILTWDLLCRRGWSGPGICALCKMASEDILHLFIQCPVTCLVWQFICSELQLSMTWCQSYLHNCYTQWIKEHKQHSSLPLFICWGVWLHRNSIIFEDRNTNWLITGLKILALYKEYLTVTKPRKIRDVPPLDIELVMVGFFDGAAVDGMGGCGFILYINKEHFYRGWTGLLACTNNLAEITAVWSLLYWANKLNLKELRVCGDSLLVINWLLGSSMIHASNLAHRGSRVQELITLFEQIQFEHIFREHNMEADKLSKKGIGCPEGILQIEEIKDGNIISTSMHRIF